MSWWPRLHKAIFLRRWRSSMQLCCDNWVGCVRLDLPRRATNASEITTFYYDFENDREKHYNEYIVWRPRIHPCYINDSRCNSIFYQDINHSLCLISFKCLKNKIFVENMIYTPFWRGDANIIQNKLKSLIVDYFLGHMKHQEVNFDL